MCKPMLQNTAEAPGDGTGDEVASSSTGLEPHSLL